MIHLRYLSSAPWDGLLKMMEFMSLIVDTRFGGALDWLSVRSSGFRERGQPLKSLAPVHVVDGGGRGELSPRASHLQKAF